MNEEFIVSILEDENDGDFNAGDLSLREAIALANEQEGEDNITFNSALSGGTIALTETEPDPRGAGTVNRELLITDSVKINGLGADALTIDGVDGGNGIFRIGENIDVTLAGLTIANGKRQQFFFQNPTAGGAVVVENGASLTLEDSAILNSVADSAGAISSDGNVNIIRTLIANNESGGGALPEGAVVSNGELNIINSTVAANTGVGVTSFGTSEIANSTITDGINLIDPDSTTITSSIVARNNTDTNAASITNNFGQGITSGGNNLISNGGDLPGYIDSDIVGTADNPIDAQLGELQDNGGATQTLALQEGSPAIDAGSNPNNLETDGRGEEFDRTVGSGTDIGAFEVQEGNNGGNPVELIVSTLADERDGDFSAGDLSLREAIALANEQEGADTITFDSSLSGGTIAFNQSQERELIIYDSVAINGLGQDSLTLDGGFIFNIAQADDDVVIDGLNLVGGKIDSFGDLTLTNSTISQTIETGSDNSSVIGRGTTIISDSTIRDNDGGDNIGILIESGTATIERSTIANNEGVLDASGVIILDGATVDISNSTITNNRNRARGGIANEGTVNITNTTIANNNGGLGAGGLANSGTATVTSSILANNTGGASIGDVSGNGEFISGGNNLISNGDDATGFVDGVNGDIVGSNGDDPENPQTDLLIDAQLGELQDNGGSTPTLALLDGSPAIDAGSNPNNLETDQRGAGFDRTVGGGTDIGAFEVQDGGGNPVELVVSTLEDENDGDFSAGDLSLREAIAQAESGETITFNSSLSGGTINLALGELAIDNNLTIDGLGAENILIDAGGNSRVFYINDNSETQSEVVINDLTIANGRTSVAGTDEASGAGVFNTENLEINNAIIRDNSAALSGGGIFSEGTLTVNNSAIHNNDARRLASGGGINNVGTATINQSTIVNNGVNARASGGGINNSGTLTVSNSTVSGNSTGISNSGGEVTLTSTIVAGNSGNDDLQNDDIISGGNNLIGGEGTSSLSRPGGLANIEDSDIVGTAENPIDAQLGELQDNGGATPTLALLDGSPAIDAGSNPNNLETDQRGAGFDRTVGGGTDIGAFEVQEVDNSLPQATNGDDRIDGSNEDDLILGLDGSDSLNGNDGADTILGGAGDDLISGGLGNDLLDGSSGDDDISGDRGRDTLIGGQGGDTLNGEGGNDFILGGINGDSLLGGQGSDTLNGEAGNDFINGEDGFDLLVGGAGDDTLLGGRGRDIFFLDSVSTDTIVDFVDGSDRLQLSEQLSFGQISIGDNDSNTGALIQDSTNNNFVMALVENIRAADLTVDDFA